MTDLPTWAAGTAFVNRAPTRTTGRFYGHLAAADRSSRLDDRSDDVETDGGAEATPSHSMEDSKSYRDRDQTTYRLGKKEGRTWTISHDLSNVLDHVVDDGRESKYVERAIWRALHEDLGADLPHHLITAQENLADHERLAEPKPIDLETGREGDQ